jgi:hypothetical protein
MVFINRNGVNDGSDRRLDETPSGRFKTLTGGARSERLYKRRIAIRYDSSATVFLYAIILAAKLYFGCES